MAPKYRAVRRGASGYQARPGDLAAVRRAFSGHCVVCSLVERRGLRGGVCLQPFFSIVHNRHSLSRGYVSNGVRRFSVFQSEDESSKRAVIGGSSMFVGYLEAREGVVLSRPLCTSTSSWA